MTFEERKPSSGQPALIAVVVGVIIAAAFGAYYLHPRFESQPPQVQLSSDTDALGAGALEIRVSDAGSGLKSIEVKLGDATVAAEQFAQPVREKTVSLAIGKLQGVKEGPATLRIVARDASLFRGNETVLEKKL